MMNKQFGDTAYARFYLWVAKAKYTMGMFYLAFTLAYLFFGFLLRQPVAIDFFLAIQMMFASFIIGIAQKAILPQSNITLKRGILWLAVGVAVTVSFSLVFGWFAAFPAWCFPAFLLVLIVGMGGMILSYYLELHQETKLLNRHLEQFQSKNMPK